MTEPRFPADGGAAPRRKKSLLDLVTDLPTLVTDLVHREIELIKSEVIGKLKALGIGAGLLVGALGILLFMVGTLLTAGILALSLVMPGWLAALLVSLVLLIAAAIVGLIGWRKLQSGLPPVPTESIDSLQRDLRAIKGTGKRGAP